MHGGGGGGRPRDCSRLFVTHISKRDARWCVWWWGGGVVSLIVISVVFFAAPGFLVDGIASSSGAKGPGGEVPGLRGSRGDGRKMARAKRKSTAGTRCAP